MAFKNYYAILGVSPTADAKAIKSAYRRLARKLHPDSPHYNSSSMHSFHEVDEAYETLRDPKKRAAYDQKLFALGSVLRGETTRKPVRERRVREPREPLINIQVLWGAVGLVLTILAAFIISELGEFKRMLEFQQDGIAIETLVIKTERQANRSTRIVTVAYDVGGTSYFNSFTTDNRSYGVGDYVTFKYLPSDPNKSVQTEDINRTLIGVIGGILILIFLPMFIYLGVQVQKYRLQHHRAPAT